MGPRKFLCKFSICLLSEEPRSRQVSLWDTFLLFDLASGVLPEWGGFPGGERGVSLVLSMNSHTDKEIMICFG